MKLYEISEKLIALQGKLERGELTQEQVADTLESLDMSFQDKVEGTIKMIKSFEAEAKAYKEASDEFKAKEKRAKQSAERLKNYLDTHLRAQEIEELKAGMFTISYRKNPPSVEILQEENLPRAYKRTKIVVEADKTKIKKALQDGEEVPGAKLITDKKTLKID